MAYTVFPATCKQCRQGFTPARKWQEFCCDRCRIRYHVEQKELEQKRKDELIDTLEAENARLLAEVKALQQEIHRLKFP